MAETVEKHVVLNDAVQADDESPESKVYDIHDEVDLSIDPQAESLVKEMYTQLSMANRDSTKYKTGLQAAEGTVASLKKQLLISRRSSQRLLASAFKCLILEREVEKLSSQLNAAQESLGLARKNVLKIVREERIVQSQLDLAGGMTDLTLESSLQRTMSPTSLLDAHRAAEEGNKSFEAQLHDLMRKMTSVNEQMHIFGTENDDFDDVLQKASYNSRFLDELLARPSLEHVSSHDMKQFANLKTPSRQSSGEMTGDGGGKKVKISSKVSTRTGRDEQLTKAKSLKRSKSAVKKSDATSFRRKSLAKHV